ncbi:hypothetical protein FRC20_011748, partial [Serendipita sp. 405]
GEGSSQDVTDLILVVHGIGQGLSTQYESYNFVYMVNLMRIIARKQAMSPALNSIMRSHNVQFLPVQWRTNLKLDEDESRRRAEDGLDNRFSLADITLKKHIPMIRELSNEVLIDIPYFMSHHQTKMIETVCSQANRTYRLWCARNPSFSTTGRVVRMSPATADEFTYAPLSTSWHTRWGHHSAHIFYHLSRLFSHHLPIPLWRFPGINSFLMSALCS